VVSVGTGFFSQPIEPPKPSLWWDLIVSQLIATSVDTEDIHTFLVDFLPTDVYFRFNAPLFKNLPIDELRPDMLTELKKSAKGVVIDMESGKDAKRVETLFKALRGEQKK
jgi:hypothetical protein